MNEEKKEELFVKDEQEVVEEQSPPEPELTEFEKSQIIKDKLNIKVFLTNPKNWVLIIIALIIFGAYKSLMRFKNQGIALQNEKAMISEIIEQLKFDQSYENTDDDRLYHFEKKRVIGYKNGVVNNNKNSRWNGVVKFIGNEYYVKMKYGKNCLIKQYDESEIKAGLCADLIETYEQVFPDENYRRVVLKALYNDKNMSAERLKSLSKAKIEENKLAGITEITAGNENIENLKGSHYLVNLNSLSLYNNQIKELSTLVRNTNLQTLIVNDNAIFNLDGLEKLIQLSTLYLDKNKINDIKALHHLKALNKLSLSENEIVDIAPLNSKTNVKELNLSHNQITNIVPIESLINLEKLNLSNNPIQNLKSFHKYPNIKELRLDNLRTNDIKYLFGITNVQILSLSNNRINNIYSLRNLKNIKELNLANNELVNINHLAKLRTLEKLNLQNNKIKDFTAVNNLPHSAGFLLSPQK